MSPDSARRVDVEGRELRLSNLEKVLYPEVGFTKAEVIDYYVRIGPTILPHLRDRPITLKRYPDGVDAGYFYEKNCPAHRPAWVRVAPVATSSRSDGGRADIDFCVVDDLPTLVWVANLASLELHPYLHTAGDVDRPSMVVFDLDPGPPAGLEDCVRVALRLREVLDGLGLRSVVKTSGSKGLQVYLPINVPTSYARTTPFARAVAQLLERDDPRGVVSNMRKDLRRGKVLVDWSQNNAHKTTIGVYSLRARTNPTVSAPVTWEEVEVAGDRGDASGLVSTAGAVLDRVAARGDVFEPAIHLEQDLPSLR